MTAQSRNAVEEHLEIETDVNVINEVIQMRLQSKIKNLEQDQAEQLKARENAKEINRLSSKFRFKNGGLLTQKSAANNEEAAHQSQNATAGRAFQ